MKVFRELDDQMIDLAVIEYHSYVLIKIIFNCYCMIRLHHFGKEITEKVRKKSTASLLCLNTCDGVKMYRGMDKLAL